MDTNDLNGILLLTIPHPPDKLYSKSYKTLRIVNYYINIIIFIHFIHVLNTSEGFFRLHPDLIYVLFTEITYMDYNGNRKCLRVC